MNNNHGFTLVELLAMLTVLSILMTVAIPNIMGIVNNQKASVLKSDATIFADKAKNYLARNTKTKREITSNKCLVFSLNYLDDNEDLLSGPNDGEYDRYDSFVVVQKVNRELIYCIRLIENVKEKTYGFDLLDSKKINQKSNSFIKAGITKLNNDGSDADKTRITGKCATIPTTSCEAKCQGGIIEYYK